MKLLTYEDYYEFGCKYDKPITETDKLRITTGLNIDGHLNYVKIYRKGEKGVCRVRIDKCRCKYWVSDFNLNYNEANELESILKKNWKIIINLINDAKKKENIKPLIGLRTRLFIPNYNVLKNEAVWDIKYFDFYEFGDSYLGSTNYSWIESILNIDPDLNYISIHRLGRWWGESGCCRLFLDKPEYFISGFHLKDNEIDALNEFINSNWHSIIKILNEDRKIDEQPLLDENMKIPDYTQLKGREYE